MINEDDIERAVNWLAANASAAAKARAEREYMSEFRKSLKAKLMQEFSDKPLAAAERDAYASDRYIEHLDAYRTAIEIDEKMRWLQAAAEAKLSAWQSQMRSLRTN
jgi:hypothetical protein